MKAYRIFLKFLKYTLLGSLILIALAIAGVYFFQDKIIQYTFSALNKHLATRIEIDDKVNLSVFEKFPEISIRINNVNIYESYPGSKEKLATLKSLYLTFHAFDFLQGRQVLRNIYAEHGAINLKINKNGTGNYFILKEDSSASGDASFDLRKIVLEDVTVNYVNEAIHQDHRIHAHRLSSSLKLNDKSWFIGLSGTMLVHQIGIGGNYYLQEKEVVIKSQQEFHEKTQLFRIIPSIVKVEGSEFHLSGHYQGNDKKEIDLAFKAENSSIATLLSLLPGSLSKRLNDYKSSGNIYLNASVKGNISATASPAIRADFGFSNASFYHPQTRHRIDKAKLEGSYSNGGLHNLRSSSLVVKNIRGEIDGRVFEGNLLIQNFEDPQMQLRFQGSADLQSLLSFYPQNAIVDASGLLNLNVSFKGRISDLETRQKSERVLAEGTIGMENIYLKLKDFPLPWSGINGSFDFTKTDLNVREVSGKAGKTDFAIQGTFKNFISKLLTGKQVMVVDASVLSHYVDVNELAGAFSGGGRGDSSKPEGKFPYLEDYRFKLNCQAGRIVYNKFDVRDFSGMLEFSQPVAYLKDVHFMMAGGEVAVYSLVNLKSENHIEVNTKAQLASVRMDSVFYICDNFGQQALGHKNVKGEFTGDMHLFWVMDKNFRLYTPSLIASADASIKNGELNDFEPMQALSRFVDEKELSQIRFTEIRNRINIKDEVIEIPEMEIRSNFSTISISGTHTFKQKVDYKLVINLKDFKKKHQDKDAAFGAIDEDSKGNSRLFLTYKGPNEHGKYKYAWDAKRTFKKVGQDLKDEKKELRELFKKKKPEQAEEIVSPTEYQYFDF